MSHSKIIMMIIGSRVKCGIAIEFKFPIYTYICTKFSKILCSFSVDDVYNYYQYKNYHFFCFKSHGQYQSLKRSIALFHSSVVF